MHELSTVNGFAERNESLAKMIKYIANEPSSGLYYIQQHVRKSAPHVLNLNSNVLENSRETLLHTEDLEDSIAMAKSMKEYGSTIADEMIRDIRDSLAIMSSKQPRRGLILNARRSRSSSKTTTMTKHGSDYSQDYSESSSYFTSVFKSAKERARNIKWTQLESKDQKVESNYIVESNELSNDKESSLKTWLGRNVSIDRLVADNI